MRTRSCFLLALLFGAGHGLLADVLYSVTDLGTLGLNQTVEGQGINNLGQVVGDSYASGGPSALSHAFVYKDGQMTDLGPGNAHAINNTGQITGEFITFTGRYHAFLYSGGQRMDLGAFGGTNSVGSAINTIGQVTGTVNPISIGSHAFVYNNGAISIPDTLVSGFGINDAGEVTGYTNANDRPAIYSHGQTTELGVFHGAGFAINNAGQVTGYFNPSPDGSHAFLYSNGQMKDLGTLGGDSSYGYAINDAGQVTGQSETSTGVAHAFLYNDGRMTDLGDLVDPALGLNLYEARGINDKGQIVANGSSPAGGRAYLLTPVPEPGTVALLGISCLLLVWPRTFWLRR